MSQTQPVASLSDLHPISKLTDSTADALTQIADAITMAAQVPEETRKQVHEGIGVVRDSAVALAQTTQAIQTFPIAQRASAAAHVVLAMATPFVPPAYRPWLLAADVTTNALAGLVTQISLQMSHREDKSQAEAVAVEPPASEQQESESETHGA